MIVFIYEKHPIIEELTLPNGSKKQVCNTKIHLSADKSDMFKRISVFSTTMKDWITPRIEYEWSIRRWVNMTDEYLERVRNIGFAMEQPEAGTYALALDRELANKVQIHIPRRD